MKYVIIGGSAAGVNAADAIRKCDKESSITLISDETLPLYSRCLLTYLIAGTINETKLCFKDKDFYKKKLRFVNPANMVEFQTDIPEDIMKIKSLEVTIDE